MHAVPRWKQLPGQTISRELPRLHRVTEAVLHDALRDTLLVIPGKFIPSINRTLRFIFNYSDLVEQERGLQAVLRTKIHRVFSIPFFFLSIICMISIHSTMFNPQMSG